MTIETTANRISYTGSGTTGPFSFPYYFLADGDLTVIKTTIADGTESTLTLTTDYTVSGAGEAAGGSVTLVATLSSAYKLTIIRDPDILQPADYPANDRFPAATHEQALDRATMIMQRLKDLLDRSFRLSDGDVSGISLVLSNLAAGKLIAVNAAGDGIESIAAADVDLATVTPFIQTLLDDADAATARTTLGAAATGANIFTGLQTFAAGADIASASTLDLTAATGNIVRITGTIATSAFKMTDGQWHMCIADAAWPLTYHATTNKLNTGGSNYTCAAGDRVLLHKDNSNIIQATIIPTSGQAVIGTGSGYPMDFRLTLTSGNPVVDIAGGATTVYCTPYIGNKIALHDGASTWNIRTSAEFSLAIGTVTAGLPYDVFCYDNAGTPTLEKLAWASNTARATGITRQDGVYVKSGATTRRYLGTFACYNTTQSADSPTYRLLWNYYNRRPRAMSVVDTTNSWTYTTPTWRQANAASTNVLNIITGVAEDMASISVMCQVNNATGAACSTGIGLNSTSVNSAQVNGGTAANNFTPMPAHYRGVLPIGLCAANWLEISAASGTTTWYGDNNLTYTQSGIYAEIMS